MRALWTALIAQAGVETAIGIVIYVSVLIAFVVAMGVAAARRGRRAWRRRQVAHELQQVRDAAYRERPRVTPKGFSR